MNPAHYVTDPVGPVGPTWARHWSGAIPVRCGRCGGEAVYFDFIDTDPAKKQELFPHQPCVRVVQPHARGDREGGPELPALCMAFEVDRLEKASESCYIAHPVKEDPCP